jgi:hypothetical protein
LTLSGRIYHNRLSKLESFELILQIQALQKQQAVPIRQLDVMAMRVLLSNCLIIINAALSTLQTLCLNPKLRPALTVLILSPNDSMVETVFKQEDELKGYLSIHCSKKHK